MIQSTIETKVPPKVIWDLWKKAHNGGDEFVSGAAGRRGAFSYQILEVLDGSSFTILWKSFFVKMHFTHSVTKIPQGSKVAYSVKMKGFFAWPMRYLLRSKIEKNLNHVLRSLSKQLETRGP